MRTTIRLTFKQLRFEAVALGVALALLAAALLVIAIRLNGLDIPACRTPGPGPADCLDRLRDFDDFAAKAAAGQVLAAVLPVFAALVLGVALIGRELERGTTTLAWTLGRSRGRWLLARGLIVGMALLGVSMVVGLASGVAQQAASPRTDLAMSFDRIEVRGTVVAARALAVFGLALLAGGLLGRTLPALLLAAIAAAGLYLGVDRAMNDWVRAEATPIVATADYTADRIIETRWQDPATGRILTGPEFVAATSPSGAPPDWQPPNFNAIPIGLPGSRSGEYATIETALLGGLTVLAAVGSAIVVERRRPY